MTLPEIRAALVKLLADYSVSISPVHPSIQDSDTPEDLGVDSLDLVLLVIDAEDQFKIEIPDPDLESIKTFGDFVTLVSSHVNKQP